MRSLPVFVNSTECAACGGSCCKSMPGATFPEDWGTDRAAMVAKLGAALRTGKWAIDWWEGDPRGRARKGDRVGCGYFVRPATTNARGAPRDPSWGGQCVMLGADGCALAHDDRPRDCRTLEPKPADAKGHRPCKTHARPKQDAAIAWIPFHDVILAAERIAEGGAP